MFAVKFHLKTRRVRVLGQVPLMLFGACLSLASSKFTRCILNTISQSAG